MSWRKKIKIIGLLGAAGVAVGVTIYRLVKLITYLDSTDVASDFVLLDFLTYVIRLHSFRYGFKADFISSRMLELSIGFACSCLPALNILIATLRKTSTDANSPRSGHRRKHGGAHPWTGGLTWHWLGETTPQKTSSTEVTGTTPSAEERRKKFKRLRASGLTGFELELAMLSGQDIVDARELETFERPNAEVEGGSDRGVVGQSGGGSNPWFTGEQATACDGRREGWLDACSHSDEQDQRRHQRLPSITLQVPDGHEDSGSSGSKRSRAISSRLSEVSGNKPWEYIWDGRNNSDEGSEPPYEDNGNDSSAEKDEEKI